LAQFPLIVIDEPHFANDQALKIVESAYTSLCFGTTGSPIEASGQALKTFVLFSLYDYDEANTHDHSLKYLSADTKEFAYHVEELTIQEADILIQGQAATTTETDDEWYKKNIVPAFSVAAGCVRYVHHCDRISRTSAELAPHREPVAHFLPSYHYPMHALIKVDSIEIGRHVVDALNAMFGKNPLEYPPEKGYAANLVSTDAEPGRAEWLTPKHPWMISKNLGGKLNVHCARFLVVVGMAREGVDNPLCGCCGLACATDSIIEIVQRILGRQGRANIVRLPAQDELFQVPTARMDSMKVVTHVAYKNVPVLRHGMDFLRDMRGHLSDLMTMEDLLAEQARPEGEDIDPKTFVTTKTKIDIAATLGIRNQTGEGPTDDEIIDGQGEDNPIRRKKIRDWIDDVRSTPQHAWEKLTKRAWEDAAALGAALIVQREYPSTNPTTEDLVHLVQVHHPELLNFLPELNYNPGLRATLHTLYTVHVKKFFSSFPKAYTTLSEIRKSTGRRILAYIGEYLWETEVSLVYAITGNAMKQLLGVPKGQKAEDGSNWDIPQCHAILQRPEVQHKIVGYVITQLAKKGALPDLTAGFGFTPEADTQTDEDVA
jgi:hypothetical protein